MLIMTNQHRRDKQSKQYAYSRLQLIDKLDSTDKERILLICSESSLKRLCAHSRAVPLHPCRIAGNSYALIG